MFTLAACLSLGTAALAQQSPGTCGTTFEDQLASRPRLRENLAAVDAGNYVADRGAIQYVPIFFHLVGDASGNGKHKERLVLDQLCKLNAAYAPMDIRFYLSPHPIQGLFDYSINNAGVYTSQTNTTLMQNRRHANALNVYVVNEAVSGNGQPGVTLAYYTPQRDWIVSRKDQINGNSPRCRQLIGNLCCDGNARRDCHHSNTGSFADNSSPAKRHGVILLRHRTGLGVKQL